MEFVKNKIRDKRMIVGVVILLIAGIQIIIGREILDGFISNKNSETDREFQLDVILGNPPWEKK